MKIDLEALRKATIGDPDAKVAVKRAWLKAVHAELEAARGIRPTSGVDRMMNEARRAGGFNVSEMFRGFGL